MKRHIFCQNKGEAMVKFLKDFKTFIMKKLYLFLLIALWHLNFNKTIESKIALKMLDTKKDEIILDLACGNGVFTRKLVKRGCRVAGIDISPKAILSDKKITERGCNLLVGDAESLPFKNEVFDKVVSLCSLEHFENDEEALREIYRVLKVNGIVVLTVDSFTWNLSGKILSKHKMDHAVVNYYSIKELKIKLEKLGFRVVSYKYFVNSPISVFFLKFGVRRKFGYTYKVIFPVAYIMSAISDKFLATKEKGIFLAVKAVKYKP
jgi:ubiquinone/menaquinone biosynthesis C-methylase UbiE